MLQAAITLRLDLDRIIVEASTSGLANSLFLSILYYVATQFYFISCQMILVLFYEKVTQVLVAFWQRG